MAWTVETLNETVEEELMAMPGSARAKLGRIVKVIEEENQNLQKIASQSKDVKKLKTSRDLWEIHLSAGSSAWRGYCVEAKNDRIVLVAIAEKKDGKTQRRSIQLALSRAREADRWRE